MILITPSLAIDEKEITYEFIRAAGPGGQNINKVASAVQLRFDVRGSPSLPADVKGRLIILAGKRITREGVLILAARRHRTQEQNRLDATQRLVNLIRKALVKPKTRRPGRPSASAKAARVETKKRHGAIKRIRQSRPAHDD